MTGVLPVSHDYKVTSPFEQGYLVGSNMDLTTSYTTHFDGSVAIEDGFRVGFYVPNCQNPGTLTVEITYTVD